jgi:hypothetical protein
MLTFVTVTFAYYALARAEERECSAKFGKPYDDYLERTWMLVPFDTTIARRLPKLRLAGARRLAVMLCVYVALLLASAVIANALRHWSVRSLYATYTDDTAIISLTSLDEPSMRRIADDALAHPPIARALTEDRADSEARFILYILPAEWFMSDIPMSMEGNRGHHQPSAYDENRVKVLVMRAILGESEAPRGEELLLSARHREPLFEVEIDRRERRVVAVTDPPATVRWGGIPTPLY